MQFNTLFPSETAFHTLRNLRPKFHYAIQLANQLVRELVCDLLATCYSQLLASWIA